MNKIRQLQERKKLNNLRLVEETTEVKEPIIVKKEKTEVKETLVKEVPKKKKKGVFSF